MRVVICTLLLGLFACKSGPSGPTMKDRVKGFCHAANTCIEESGETPPITRAQCVNGIWEEMGSLPKSEVLAFMGAHQRCEQFQSCMHLICMGRELER